MSDSYVNGKGRGVFERLSTILNMDLILFRAEIGPDTSYRLRKVVEDRSKKRKDVGLIITTFGGVPDDAYRIARCLQESYSEVTMFVFGQCKSAGTLVITGGNRLVISDWGELGPMDIQILREDQMFRESGVVTEEAFSRLRQESDATFRKLFSSVLEFGGGTISLKTASEIAVSLTSGLLSPLTAQVDPLKVGETARQMRILVDYAERLSKLSRDRTLHAVARLSSAYSSHSFVIDRKEATELFGQDFVRAPDEPERFLARSLGELARYPPQAPQQDGGTLIEYLDQVPPRITLQHTDPAQLALFFEQHDGGRTHETTEHDGQNPRNGGGDKTPERREDGEIPEGGEEK